MKWFRRKATVDPSQCRSRQRFDRKTFVIHHYCPHTYNAGDHFVIRSIRQHLLRYLPEAVFVPKASAYNRGWGMPVRLTGKNLEYSNQYADAVIVGGSDQYNNWSLRIKKAEIGRLVPPLYLIGMGVSSRSLDDPPSIEKSSYLEDIRATHEHARLVAVRDKITREFLENLGYHGAVVTGCPAMFLYNEPFAAGGEGILALPFPFPVVRKNRPAVYKRLLEVLSFGISQAKKRGLEPVVVCHDDRDVPEAQQHFPGERIFFSNYVDEVIDFYRQVTFVIGSRLHATLLCAGMGKPFVNINLDVRGTGFSHTFGMQEWNINVDEPLLFTALENRIQRLIRGELDVFHAFYDRKQSYRTVFLEFMKNVAEDIRRVVGKEPGDAG
jgi:hypothetical protein